MTRIIDSVTHPIPQSLTEFFSQLGVTLSGNSDLPENHPGRLFRQRQPLIPLRMSESGLQIFESLFFPLP